MVAVVPLAKNVLNPLGLATAVCDNDPGIQKKIHELGFTHGAVV